MLYASWHLAQVCFVGLFSENTWISRKQSLIKTLVKKTSTCRKCPDICIFVNIPSFCHEADTLFNWHDTDQYIIKEKKNNKIIKEWKHVESYDVLFMIGTFLCMDFVRVLSHENTTFLDYIFSVFFHSFCHYSRSIIEHFVWCSRKWIENIILSIWCMSEG